MKVFVTGGAGFIGKSVVKSLLRRGDIVTIYDNFSNSSEDSISDVIKRGANLIKGDIIDYDLLERSLEGFDVVIHLAAMISVDESVRNPEKIHQINVSGTLNLLRACVARNIKNIVNVSSAAVYSDGADIKLSEKSITVPLSPYGASKLDAERHMQEFSKKYDLNCITLRPFNVYGIGQTDSYAGVITKFKKKIVEGKSLVIFGDGSNTRDFVAIEDVVFAIQNAIENIVGKQGNCYNIASEKHVTINELAKLMISISGKSNLQIEYDKPRKGDIKDSQASILLAKKELGYHPKVELRQGLEKLLKTFLISVNISSEKLFYFLMITFQFH